MNKSISSDSQKETLRKTPTVSKQGSEPSNNKIEGESPLEFLRGVREFKDIPEQSLKLLAEFSRFENFESGEYLISEGEEDGIYGFILVAGRASMLKNSPNGRELIVELLEPRDLFGLLLTLVKEHVPAQLSTRALQKTTVLWVPMETFYNVTSRHPDLMKGFISHLLRSLQSSYCLSRGLAHDQVNIRIAAVLVSLGLKFPEWPAPPGAIEIHFTRQQLADLAGTTPETAIRVTRAMEKQKLLKLGQPGVIEILDFDALEAIVEDLEA